MPVAESLWCSCAVCVSLDQSDDWFPGSQALQSSIIPILLTARVVPAAICGEITLCGAGWLNSSKAQAAPAPGDHSWTSFSNGTWPSWSPEAPFPVIIPLNLPGAMTNERQNFLGCASAYQKLQHLQGKTKTIQEKWSQTFKGWIQRG